MNDVITILESRIKQPKYTIAIPTFKRHVLLADAINSAINQTYDGPYEIVVVDNNPIRNDDTEIMMANYSGHGNISYYKNKENIGMAGNWNRLYSLSTGDFVVMLHDDDMLYPQYLEVLSKFQDVTKNKYDLIYVYTNTSKDRMLPDHVSLPNEIEYRILTQLDFIKEFATPALSGMVINRLCVNVMPSFSNEFFPFVDILFSFEAVKLFSSCLICTQLVLYYVINNATSCLESERSFETYARFHNYMINEMPFPLNILKKLCLRSNELDMYYFLKSFYSEKLLSSNVDRPSPRVVSRIAYRLLKKYLRISRTRKLLLLK